MTPSKANPGLVQYLIHQAISRIDKMVNPDLIVLLALGIYTVILAILIAILKTKGAKEFNKINV